MHPMPYESEPVSTMIHVKAYKSSVSEIVIDGIVLHWCTDFVSSSHYAV